MDYAGDRKEYDRGCSVSRCRASVVEMWCSRSAQVPSRGTRLEEKRLTWWDSDARAGNRKEFYCGYCGGRSTVPCECSER